MTIAQTAYDAYGNSVGWNNYQGLPMPSWDALPEKIQSAWIAATQTAVESHVRDTPVEYQLLALILRLDAARQGPRRESVHGRYVAIAITDLEKVVAFLRTYLA